MSIRLKTFCICGGLSLGGLLTLAVLLWLFLGVHIEEIERQTLTADAQRMVRAVAYEVDSLGDFNADWAVWDDTYAYLRTGGTAFEANNLTTSVFQQQKLHRMLLVDGAGTVRFGRAYDEMQGAFVAMAPEEEAPFLQLVARLARRGQERQEGVLLLPRGPLLVAAHRVYDSQKQQRGDGWLVMGRYLGEFADGPVRWTVDGRVSWTPVREEGASDWLGVQGYENVPLQLRQEEEAGYAQVQLADVLGTGSLRLSLEEPRSYYQQSLQMFGHLALLLTAMILLGGGATYFLMERLVLRRLTLLTRYLEGIQGFEAEFPALSIRGHDEIALLSRRLQEMLQHLLRAHRKMRYLGWHDGLTGALNRLAYETDFQAWRKESARSLGLVSLDIDGLKLVNDALGHARGDALLRHLVQMIEDSPERDGRLYRIGGDEFVVLLPGITADGLQRWVAGLRPQLDRLEMEGGLPCSVSLGFAWGQSGCDGEELARKADRMMYGEKLFRQHSRCNEVVQSLREALAVSDHITEGHASRLGVLAVALAQTIKAPPESLAELRLLAEFHDVGKIGIPDHILNKPGKLDADEWEEMRKHSEIGYRLAQATPALQSIASFILHHHEWWNGQGYPLGLAGEAIPLSCRILAIVDAYDAMTNDRPYRRALGRVEAVAELRRQAGAQFDPALVEAFLRVLRQEQSEWAEAERKERVGA